MASRKLVIEVPESVLAAEKTDEVTFAHELKLLAAIKLYELGRLSSAGASDLAGMARVEFLLQLGRHQVFPFEAELRELEASRIA
jgi:predicted HTH domain antitoxin